MTVGADADGTLTARRHDARTSTAARTRRSVSSRRTTRASSSRCPRRRETYRFSFDALLHEQAAVRTEARPRQRAAALRVRGRARQDRREARDRSDRAAPAQRRAPRRRRRSTACASRRTATSSASTRVERASGWKERRGKLGFGRGLGVASSAYISGTNYPIYPNEMPQSAVQLKVDRSGVVTVFSGASEIGQGSDTMLRTIVVATSSALDLGAVRVVSADTDLCPVDLGAYSSRGTFMNGNAVSVGARDKSRERPRGRARARAADAPVSHELVRAVAEAPLAEAIARRPSGWLPLAAEARRRLPRRDDRRVARVLVHRARRRGRRRRGDGLVRVVKRLVRARLRAGASARTIVERPDRRQRVHGRRRGDRSRSTSSATRAVSTAVRTCSTTASRRASTCPSIDAIIVESHDPEGPLGAKEAGEGPLHSSDSRDRERDLRRGRRAHPNAAVHSRARARALRACDDAPSAVRTCTRRSRSPRRSRSCGRTRTRCSGPAAPISRSR